MYKPRKVTSKLASYVRERLELLSPEARKYAEEVINLRTGLPYSRPKLKLWRRDTYFIWRWLRFDLGIDPRLPIMAEALVRKEEAERLRSILKEIEDVLYPPPLSWIGALRWAPYLGRIVRE